MSTLLEIHTSLCLILTLTLARTSSAKPSFIENDSIVFPDKDNNTAINTTLSDKLQQCIKEDKIEFNARLPKPAIRGKCVPRRCSSKQHFWADQNRCVFSNESFALCPTGNTIQTDFFGDGYCECVKQPVHAHDASGACYPVFTRGPCRADGVWVKVHGQAECRSDQCTALRAKLPGKVVVPWPDQKCYPVKDQGPCNPGYVVSVNPHSFLPQCADPLAPLTLVEPPCSGTDHNGNCVIATGTQKERFIDRVTDQSGKKRPIKQG